MNQKITLSLGGIRIELRSDLPLKLGDALNAFRTAEGGTDYVLRIVETDVMPVPPQNRRGEDLLQTYYEGDGVCWAVGKPGSAGVIAATEYLPDFSRMTMYVRASRPSGLFESFDKALQLLPVRELLLRERAVLLHSSQVAVKGAGILFTAPSGTGKSTQARLWERYEGARLVCNDRTLLRGRNGGFETYGYPVDGSSPVCSTERNRLGAVVVLRQAEENRAERLSAAKALKYLMEQTVADAWNPNGQGQILRLWISLLERYPVYRLDCTPDRSAAACLKKRLEEDEVI